MPRCLMAPSDAFEAFPPAAFSKTPCPATKRGASSSWQRLHLPLPRCLQSVCRMGLECVHDSPACAYRPSSIRRLPFPLWHAADCIMWHMKPVASSITSPSSPAPGWGAWRYAGAAECSLRPGMPSGRLPIRIGHAASLKPAFPHPAQNFLIQREDVFVSPAIFAEATLPRCFLGGASRPEPPRPCRRANFPFARMAALWTQPDHPHGVSGAADAQAAAQNNISYV